MQGLYTNAEATAKAEVWDYIGEKSVYNGALFFDEPNLANSNPCQKQSNGRCSRVCIMTVHVVLVRMSTIRMNIHHRVGFCVARFDKDGQCKSLGSWDEQLVQQPTLFHFMYRTHNRDFKLVRGCCET